VESESDIEASSAGRSSALSTPLMGEALEDDLHCRIASVRIQAIMENDGVGAGQQLFTCSAIIAEVE
jgi:hypothetical protein